MPPAAVLPPPTTALAPPPQPAAGKPPRPSSLSDPPTQSTVSDLPRAADHQPPPDPAASLTPTMGATPTPRAVPAAAPNGAEPPAGVSAAASVVAAPPKRARQAEPSVAPSPQAAPKRSSSAQPTTAKSTQPSKPPPPPVRPVSKPAPQERPAKQPTHQPPTSKPPTAPAPTPPAAASPAPSSSAPKAAPGRIATEAAKLVQAVMDPETPSDVTLERPARDELVRLAAPKPAAPPELAEYWCDFMETQEEEFTDKSAEAAKKADPQPWDAYPTSQSVIDALIHVAVDRVQPGFGCGVTARLRRMSKQEQLRILCDEEHELRRICAEVVDRSLPHSRSCAACVKSISTLFTKRSDDDQVVEMCALDTSSDEMCTCAELEEETDGMASPGTCGCDLMGDVVGAFLRPQLQMRFATRHPWMAADLASAIVEEASCEAELVCLLEDPDALFKRMVGEVEDALFSLTQRARRKVLREDMKTVVEKLHKEKFHKVLAIIMREKDDIALIRLLQYPDLLAQRVKEADAEVAENEEKAREKRALKRQAENDAKRAKATPSPPSASPAEAPAVAAQRALLQTQRARTQRTGTMHLYRTASTATAAVTATAAAVTAAKPLAQANIRAIPLVRELETPAQRPAVRAGPALPAVKRRKVDPVTANGVAPATAKPPSAPATASAPTTVATVARTQLATAAVTARSKFGGAANRSQQPVTAPATVAAVRSQPLKPQVRKLVRPAPPKNVQVHSVHTAAARIRPPAQPRMPSPAPQLPAKRPAPTTTPSTAVAVQRQTTGKNAPVTAASLRAAAAASRPAAPVTAATPVTPAKAVTAAKPVTANRTQPVVSRVAPTVAATVAVKQAVPKAVVNRVANGGVKKTTAPVVARPVAANGASPNTKVLHAAAAQVRRPTPK